MYRNHRSETFWLTFAIIKPKHKHIAVDVFMRKLEKWKAREEEKKRKINNGNTLTFDSSKRRKKKTFNPRTCTKFVQSWQEWWFRHVLSAHISVFDVYVEHDLLLLIKARCTKRKREKKAKEKKKMRNRSKETRKERKVSTLDVLTLFLGRFALQRNGGILHVLNVPRHTGWLLCDHHVQDRDREWKRDTDREAKYIISIIVMVLLLPCGKQFIRVYQMWCSHSVSTCRIQQDRSMFGVPCVQLYNLVRSLHVLDDVQTSNGLCIASRDAAGVDFITDASA